jgi:tetratricopeptide (TPR) repeat protein
MLGIIFIFAFTIFLAFFMPTQKPAEDLDISDIRTSTQMKKLWSIAQLAMKDRKPLRAEKALLTILKFDEKNAAAYNRLGILYAKEHQFKQAIECFEIAQSLDNNASSLHNAGLIYLETGNYEKAAQAFKQAIELEGDLPARYIAFAKAEEKLGHAETALEALETAYELNHTPTMLRHIYNLHIATANPDAAEATKLRLAEFQSTRKQLSSGESSAPTPQSPKPRHLLRRRPSKTPRPPRSNPKKPSRKVI